ncbi:MAG: DUF6056 family protein [Lachnospiraceae bacterium]
MKLKNQQVAQSQVTPESSRRLRLATCLIWAVFFVMAYLICTQIQYSDGDDAFFYEMAHSKGFFEYVKYRYITWEGRATSEAMTYVAFYFGIGFWRVANAAMLTFLPAGLVHLVKKVCTNISEQQNFFLSASVCICILFMDMEVIGYSSIWMTGSTFYLWSVVCGIWAMMPFADLVRKGTVQKRQFLYSIPLGFIAAMGLEQIAAVDIAFGVIAVCYHVRKTSKIPVLPTIQTLICIVGLVVLFISPGTSARSADEIASWMPEYATMSVGNHFFITLQFLCSTLANESRMYLILLWALLMYFLWKRNDWKRYLSAVSLLLIGTTALSYFGIETFSEMGIGVPDITKRVDHVAKWSTITTQNRFAIIWWCIAIGLTIYLLWQTSDTWFDRIAEELFFLAGLACTCIMYFTPTIYASGGRVLFMMEVMFWFLILYLFTKITDKRAQYGWMIVSAFCGIIQVASGFSYMMRFF